MKKLLSARKKKAIIYAVAAGICVSGTVLPQPAEAAEQFDIGWDGKTLFNVKYYGVGDYNAARASIFKGNGTTALNYDLSSDLKSGLNKAFKWWAEILGPGANISQPAQYFVGTNDDRNAGANAIQSKYNFADIFQSGQIVPQFNDIDDLENNLDNGYALGQIIIGQYLSPDISNDGNYGWINTAYYANPTPEAIIGTDISAVMYHEIGHSLGISADKKILDVVSGKNYCAGVFNNFGEKSFTAHLYNQYGQQPKPGQVILSSEDDISAFNQSAPDGGEKLTSEKTFIVPSSSDAKKDGKIYLYFAGDNVTEVLDGKTFTRADGQQISGIPINLWDPMGYKNNEIVYYPEFSHTELARGMMSHQNYRSYVNFMEAELALLQDIGYNIDRKNFYGRSIYNDGLTLTNYQGFSKRENGEYVDGYNNSTFGIGLHIYGSNNNITQAGDIFTNGAGAVGVRVDGVNNTITVAKDTEIHADGSYNDGVLIAYGKNHNVNIDGTVTATGESGNALSFNFGSNSLGSDFEYRGSFMRYTRGTLNNEVVKAKNLGLNEISSANDLWSFTDKENGDLNAPMVNTVNISGKLVADSENAGNAIYIDMSSFVDTININDGAEITGGITSQWKHFSPYIGFYDYETPYTETDANGKTTKSLEGLKLQYKGGEYLYTKYIPDLVTKLNFNNTMKYDGDIDGMDNMKINVNGNLVYGGSADVVNVTSAKDAGLFGGTFTVNDMSAKMADGFTDDTTGKFYNHGTIGSAYSDKSMTINGDLVSDGTLSGYGGGERGDIVVNGNANVEGSTAVATNMLPDEKMTVLTANNITGELKNSATYTPVSGMMSAAGEISGKQISVTAKAENNLGALTAEQTQTFNALNNMNANLQGDSRKAELRTVYNLDAEKARQALDQIGNTDAAQLMSAAQNSSVVNRVLADRQAAAFSVRDVDLQIPVNNLADADNENNLTVPVKAKLPVQADNNTWLKFTKNWGDLKGGADYHGQAISGGYDKAVSDNWRTGFFVSYNATSLGAKNAGGNIYDTRFGVYGCYHRNADDAFIYLDGGKIRNKLRRNLSSIGLGAEAKYDANIVEIGGEYKHNLQPERIWHVSPYINLQYSSMKQDAYAETGAGIYNQHVEAKRNNYFAGQLGVEFKRQFLHGHYAARLGVKHAFTGADPELNFSYEGDANHAYTLQNNQDKTHLVLSLGGENEFAKGWILGGDVQLQKGSHDKDVSASVMLRKVW
ncbi:autotransporter outer membrane beta-barrel domain-containing protein [Selenomonas ruminantium]|uniref:autotransporter outer membrane beta-barrel domain-containing protein n=2 Tax=Selenomonas ruminantium TaxID=971 RepID=UPI000401305E|nr:autotransporter outer membrane beta-barrel domain-containing protein [Selenomonas ruminantium]